jgi:hypothetical protein
LRLVVGFNVIGLNAFSAQLKTFWLFARVSALPVYLTLILSDGPLGRDLEFAMSTERFDNGLIIKHLANEETSAKGSQPYGETGSAFGP